MQLLQFIKYTNIYTIKSYVTYLIFKNTFIIYF